MRGRGPYIPLPVNRWLMPGTGADEGVASTLEITIALLVFVLILTAYFTAVGRTFAPMERDTAGRSQSVLLSTMLLSQPGRLDDGSSGGNASWEGFPAAGDGSGGVPNMQENLTSIGLAPETPGYGVIAREKVDAMRRVTYPQARQIFGLTELGLDFHLRVRTKEEVVLDYGPEPRDGSDIFSFRRVASLDQVNRSIVPVDFPVDEKLVINEIMWHPVDAAEGGNEDPYEWIELHNPTDGTVNVSGWHILNDNPNDKENREPSSSNELIPWDDSTDTTVIAPGGFGIVVGTGSDVWDYFDTIPDSTIRLKMNFSAVTKQGLRPDGANPESGKADGERIELVDDSSRTVEFVDYSFEWGGINEKDSGKNFSLARIDPYGDANDPANWRSSESTLGEGPGGGGTPGQLNDVNDLRRNRTVAFVTMRVFDGRQHHEAMRVNEIMHDPPTGEAKHEWFEVFNPTDTAINMSGWSFSDNATEETLSPADDRGGIVPGKGFAVIVGRDRLDDVTNVTDLRDDVTVLEAESKKLGDTLHAEDTITILDEQGRIMDRVEYQSTGGADAGGGETLERVDPFGPSDMSNFEVSLTDDRLMGSAGRVNSRTVST